MLTGILSGYLSRMRAASACLFSARNSNVSNMVILTQGRREMWSGVVRDVLPNGPEQGATRPHQEGAPP